MPVKYVVFAGWLFFLMASSLYGAPINRSECLLMGIFMMSFVIYLKD